MDFPSHQIQILGISSLGTRYCTDPLNQSNLSVLRFGLTKKQSRTEPFLSDDPGGDSVMGVLNCIETEGAKIGVSILKSTIRHTGYMFQ